MKIKKFIQVNTRYFVFQSNGSYYLLDRKPLHLLSYLFFPISWLFKQKVYPITNQDYIRAIEKVNTVPRGFILSSVFTGGITVLIARWLNKTGIVEQLQTKFSLPVNIFLLLGVILFTLLIVHIFYQSREKDLLKLIKLDESKQENYIIRPSKFDWNLLKQILLYMTFWALTLITALVFLTSSSLYFLFTAGVLFLLVFLVSVGAYNVKGNYQIIYDEKEKPKIK